MRKKEECAFSECSNRACKVLGKAEAMGKQVDILICQYHYELVAKIRPGDISVGYNPDSDVRNVVK